jgi:predicted nucleotidyltransferase/plasmid maintenance system antidote protein VapI
MQIYLKNKENVLFLTQIVNTNLFKMETFSDRIRKLRMEKELPLRIVAAFLDIDQAILSKIERGIRRATREQVVKLAGYFKVEQEELLVLWLADKLVYEMKDEELAIKAMQVAEEHIEYAIMGKIDRGAITQKIKNYFATDERVVRAWVFGSFARKDDTPRSDIDIMVELKDDIKITLYDLADIQYQLEEVSGRKIDLVEEGAIKPFAWETVKNDLQLIYEK